MIKSNDPKALINLLENTQTSKPNQLEFRTEYSVNFNNVQSGKGEKYSLSSKFLGLNLL